MLKNAIGIRKTPVGPDILELSKSTVFPQRNKDWCLPSSLSASLSEDIW